MRPPARPRPRNFVAGARPERPRRHRMKSGSGKPSRTNSAAEYACGSPAVRAPIPSMMV